jgi:hypothetical protein
MLQISDALWALSLLRQDADTEEERGKIREEIDRIADTDLALKTDGYGGLKRKAEAEMAYLKGEARRYTGKAKRIEAMLDDAKDLLMYVMEKLQTDKLRGHVTTISKCEGLYSLKLDDESLLPAEYVDEITVRIPKSDLIKRDLMANKPVPGARLERGDDYIRFD